MNDMKTKMPPIAEGIREAAQYVHTCFISLFHAAEQEQPKTKYLYRHSCTLKDFLTAGASVRMFVFPNLTRHGNRLFSAPQRSKGLSYTFCKKQQRTHGVRVFDISGNNVRMSVRLRELCKSLGALCPLFLCLSNPLKLTGGKLCLANLPPSSSVPRTNSPHMKQYAASLTALLLCLPSALRRIWATSGQIRQSSMLWGVCSHEAFYQSQ